jgi:hypothetical protein
MWSRALPEPTGGPFVIRRDDAGRGRVGSGAPRFDPGSDHRLERLAAPCPWSASGIATLALYYEMRAPTTDSNV